MLKTLVLDSVGFGRGQFQTLLPACPVLEELELLNMEWRDRNEVLSSSSLKKLKITSEDGCLGTFSFDTPNLVFLDYVDFLAKDYPLVNLDNLVEAWINLMVTADGFSRGYQVWNLIRGIQNVKILHLSPTTFLVLSLCGAMPLFKNLAILNIKTVMSQGWEAMPLILRNSPQLDTFYIDGLLHTVTDKCAYVCNCVSRKKKGYFLSKCHVKQIQIKGFRGTIREVHMIKYFLDYFPSLKVMLIYAEENEVTLFEIPKWLELVENALVHYNKRTSCNVVFVYDSLYKRWTRR